MSTDTVWDRRWGLPGGMRALHRTTASDVSAGRWASLSWWVRDRQGKVAVAQPPNPALMVWLLCVIASWTPLLDQRRGEIVTRLGQGALLAWALDELLRGASPVRRLLGGIVLPIVLWRALG